MRTQQIFIKNMSGITNENNYPILRFENDIDLYAFITRLKSTPQSSDTTVPYFVLNNTQLLPSFIRNIHVYKRMSKNNIPAISEDSETDTDSDDDYETFNGIFTIHENLDELKRCNIDNNTLAKKGFIEELNKFVW